MTPSKFQIYQSHFFLNFLCGILYIVIGYVVFSIQSSTDGSTDGFFEIMCGIVFVTSVVIFSLIRVNRISCERFKQYNIKISRVIYPALTYVGFTVPFAILILIVFEASFIIFFVILFIAYKIFA